MVEPTPVDDPADPRLEDYRTLTDPGLRKRYEAERGVFIVESALAVTALAASSHAPATRSVLVGEKRLARMAPVLATLAAHGAAVYTAPAEVLEATAGFPLHRGVVACVTRPEPVAPEALTATARTVLAVEGVNDHENLGSLFRNAAAFGVDAVLLDPTCADPWYRRCVRVSMGHVLGVPHARCPSAPAPPPSGRATRAQAPWPDALSALATAGWRVVALTPGTDVLLHELAPPTPDERVVVVVGAEGPGLDDATLRAPGVTPVRIAMAPAVDSLNVATAAAVALAQVRSPHLT